MDGTLVSGERVASDFVSQSEAVLGDHAGFTPFHGTLNLRDCDVDARLDGSTVSEVGDGFCEGIDVRPCSLWGIKAAVIRPLVPDYPERKTEILAPVRVRPLFGLTDDSPVTVSQPEERWHPSGPSANTDVIDSFDAVVFDLDGTLVNLDVEWSTVHDELERMLEPCLEKPLREYGRNEFFTAARDNGRYDAVDALLTDYEYDGAKTASALDLVEVLPKLDCPVGICTANAESAARHSLDRFDVLDVIDAFVSRGSVRQGKPHPKPLLRCIDALGVDPGDVLFVGNEPTDASAAHRAGTSFLHVDQLTSTRS